MSAVPVTLNKVHYVEGFDHFKTFHRLVFRYSEGRHKLEIVCETSVNDEAPFVEKIFSIDIDESVLDEIHRVTGE